MARPAPVTPAAPLEAMIMNNNSEICSPIESPCPVASGDVERDHDQANAFSASAPVSPTTAAIAPKAPIGAAHMIIASTLNTTR